MRPESVVAGSDTETSDVVVDDTPNDRLLVGGSCEHAIDGDGRGDGDGEKGDPLDIADEIAPSDRRKVFLLLDRRRDVVVWDVNVGDLEGWFDGLDASKCV